MKIQDGAGQMGDQHFYMESVHGPQVAAIDMLTHVIREKYVLAKLWAPRIKLSEARPYTVFL